MTKAQSPIEERRVAGIASKDDATERMCFRPGTSATCRMSDDKYPGAVLLRDWNISATRLKVLDLGHETSGADISTV